HLTRQTPLRRARIAVLLDPPLESLLNERLQTPEPEPGLRLPKCGRVVGKQGFSEEEPEGVIRVVEGEPVNRYGPPAGTDTSVVATLEIRDLPRILQHPHHDIDEGGVPEVLV